MTHYLDASGVYAAGDSEGRKLRTMKLGRLKVSVPQPGVLPLLPDHSNSFLAGQFVHISAHIFSSGENAPISP